MLHRLNWSGLGLGRRFDFQLLIELLPCFQILFKLKVTWLLFICLSLFKGGVSFPQGFCNDSISGRYTNLLLFSVGQSLTSTLVLNKSVSINSLVLWGNVPWSHVIGRLLLSGQRTISIHWEQAKLHYHLSDSKKGYSIKWNTFISQLFIDLTSSVAWLLGNRQSRFYSISSLPMLLRLKSFSWPVIL